VLGKGDCRAYPQYEDWLQGRVEEFGLSFPIEKPLYPPTLEQSATVSREEYDKLKNTMEGLQVENSELREKLQDYVHQFRKSEYQKEEAVRSQEEAERKFAVEVDFFRKTDEALRSSGSELRRVKQRLTDAHGKLAGWQEQWDAFSTSRKAKEEETVAELTGQIEKLKTLLKEKNHELLCTRSTKGYITDQLNKAQGYIEELKTLASSKKSRLEEVFGKDDGSYYREHINELDGIIHKRNLLIRRLTESPDHPDTVALLDEVRNGPYGLYTGG
jgi:chromosome segregation ATPase